MSWPHPWRTPRAAFFSFRAARASRGPAPPSLGGKSQRNKNADGKSLGKSVDYSDCSMKIDEILSEMEVASYYKSIKSQTNPTWKVSVLDTIFRQRLVNVLIEHHPTERNI